MSTSQLIAAHATDAVTHPSPSSSSPYPRPTPLPFHVRRFQPTDLPHARALLTTTTLEFGPGAGRFLHGILSADMADVSAHYIDPPSSNFFCAIDADDMTLIGMVGLRPMAVADPKYYAEVRGQGKGAGLPWSDADRVLELNRMAVLPSARRRGVASALNAECVRFARESGACGLHLSSMIGIGAARSMYRSLGYIEYRTDRFARADEGGGEYRREVKESERAKTHLPPEEVPSEAALADMRERLGVWHSSRFYMPV